MLIFWTKKMHADYFQPEKLLAVGPASKVYRGVETATGRKVLLKVLLEEHETTHPLDREKLQLLAPSLMQVRHPQIAGLITLLPREDEFALVYDYMPGMNARAFAAERQPSETDLRALAVQLMHALIVGEHLRQPHGDPKPSNLIIADHPGGGLFLQVQDWGLSLARTEHPPETQWFRAPELHAGGMPTLQSDLFTAAASLFCVATNAAPAQGTTVEEIMTDWSAFNVGVIRHMRPDLDPQLCDWLAWLMNLNPQLRPHSASQALDVLMRQMHAGFTYLPQQAPVMAAGTRTAPMGSGPPRPKPMAPKRTTVAEPKSDSNAAPPVPAPPKPPRNPKRMFAALLLNLAALFLIGTFAWAWLSENGAGLWKDVSGYISSFKVVPAGTTPTTSVVMPASSPSAETAAATSPAPVSAPKPSSKKTSKPKTKTSKTQATPSATSKPAESKK